MRTTWKSDIFFEVSFDTSLKIYYKLFNNHLTDRWINLVNNCNDSNFNLNSTHSKIYSKKEIDNLFEEFVDVIELINSVIDNKLPDIKSLKYLIENKELLNYLHEQFEIYGETNDPYIINKSMLRLNDLIHIFESIIKNEYSCFSVVNIDYQKTNTALLKSEDYFLFTPDIEWGYIYLGYNTLGKSWITVAEDNDIEVVLRNQIKPQKNFSSEFYINFNEKFSYIKKNKFYNWWLENNFSKIKKETFTIENFAFGFIPLGKIICYKLDDEVIYDTKPINTPEARLEWNKNIWSNQNSTTKIQFIKAFTNV